jgi:hypothetical protein
MKIETNKTVIYDVAKIEITDIVINKTRNNGLIFIIPHSWIDSNNNNIKTAAKKYTENELLQSINNPSLTSVINMIKNILTDNKVSLRFRLDNNSKLTATIILNINEKYSHIQLEESSLITAITPFTIENLIGFITAISIELT